MTPSHLGYSITCGYLRKSPRLAAHRDNDGKVHGLTGGPERPYEGARYHTLCGRDFIVEDDGYRLTTWIASEGGRITCKACQAITGAARQ